MDESSQRVLNHLPNSNLASFVIFGLNGLFPVFHYSKEMLKGLVAKSLYFITQLAPIGS